MTLYELRLAIDKASGEAGFAISFLRADTCARQASLLLSEKFSAAVCSASDESWLMSARYSMKRSVAVGAAQP